VPHKKFHKAFLRNGANNFYFFYLQIVSMDIKFSPQEIIPEKAAHQNAFFALPFAERNFC
jgi:hypothetical protein